MTIGGYFQRDIFNSYAARVRAPYLFSRKWGASLQYQNLTTLEPVFFDATSADYEYNNESVEGSIIYQPSINHAFELSLNLFTEDYQYVSGATNEDVPRSLRTKKQLVKLIYAFNDLNYYYQYVDGFKSVLNVQYVQSRDGILPDFVIGWNDFLWYKRIKKKGNLATRLRLGLASNDDTPFAPFAVDNNLNIRGAGNEIDRGTGAIVWNTEYRHTIITKPWIVVQGNFFVDFGTWRQPAGEFSDFVDNKNIRLFVGPGLRFILPKVFNAVVRIDYGFGMTRDDGHGVVFGVGQYF